MTIEQEFEDHISKVNQVAKIKRIMQLNDRADTCGTCDLRFYPMYTWQGYGLCPNCDEDKIEAFKARKEANLSA